MSVYSGFATRNQETLYLKLVEKALQILSEKAIKSYSPNEFYDERAFTRKMMKVHKTLTILEKQKYLQPFFSTSIMSLCNYLRQQFPSSGQTEISKMSFIDGTNSDLHSVNSKLSLGGAIGPTSSNLKQQPYLQAQILQQEFGENLSEVSSKYSQSTGGMMMVGGPPRHHIVNGSAQNYDGGIKEVEKDDEDETNPMVVSVGGSELKQNSQHKSNQQREKSAKNGIDRNRLEGTPQFDKKSTIQDNLNHS